MKIAKHICLILVVIAMLALVTGCKSKAKDLFSSVVENIDNWTEAIDKALNGETSATKRKVYDLLGKDSVDISSLDVQKVCDQILVVVGASPAIDLKDEIVSIRKEKNKLQQKNEELKEEYYLSSDQDKIEKEITKNFNKIEKLDSQIYEKKEEMRAIFGADGISLSDKNLEVLTGESYGNDVLTLSVVSLNITNVLTQYRENILEKNESSSNFNLYLKYYKLYRLAVLAQLRALDISLQHNEEYRNKLENLLQENERLMTKTKQLVQDNLVHSSSYASNLKSQEVNREVMNNFMNLLNSYKDLWTRKYWELKSVEEFVVNTINTANISNEVSTMLGETKTMIESLESIDLGEILAFDNSGLETQFQNLSSMLSESSSK